MRHNLDAEQTTGFGWLRRPIKRPQSWQFLLAHRCQLKPTGKSGSPGCLISLKIGQKQTFGQCWTMTAFDTVAVAPDQRDD
jgi:hypothetical protein